MTTEPNLSSKRADNSSGFQNELKQDTERLKGTIGERAKREGTERKNQAAQAMGSASTALEAAADELDNNPNTPDWMASAIQQAARKMDSLAGQINGRDLDEIGNEVIKFARQNPATFLAVSAAAGFAAARVLRAGMDRKRHDQPGKDSHDQSSPVSEHDVGVGQGDVRPSYMHGNVEHDVESVAL